MEGSERLREGQHKERQSAKGSERSMEGQERQFSVKCIPPCGVANTSPSTRMMPRGKCATEEMINHV